MKWFLLMALLVASVPAMAGNCWIHIFTSVYSGETKKLDPKYLHSKQWEQTDSTGCLEKASQEKVHVLKKLEKWNEEIGQTEDGDKIQFETYRFMRIRYIGSDDTFTKKM